MNQICCDYRIKIMIIITDYFHWIVKVMIKLLIFFGINDYIYTLAFIYCPAKNADIFNTLNYKALNY